jgi:uncharacterized protein YndB with AHSA1/START domain/predicted DNA-binding protein (MmcQ/YjbR family)
MPDFTTSVDIDAPPDVVFAHLVTPEGMLAWMGEHAELEPLPGGRFAVDVNGAPVRGRYVEVDPPHVVVVTWGIAGNEALPPGSSQVEFRLTPLGDGTRLELVHTGLPESWAPQHQQGWAHYLDRLRRRAAGDDPGTDTWQADTALELFHEVAAAYADRPGVQLGRTWHNEGLKVGGKVFAMLNAHGLVVKVPAAQAAALVGAGTVEAFEPRPGRRAKEWIVAPLPVGTTDDSLWHDLVADAYAYVSSLL